MLSEIRRGKLIDSPEKRANGQVEQRELTGASQAEMLPRRSRLDPGPDRKTVTMSNTLLKSFLEEFFDFDDLLEAGFFTEEMRDDYQAQAKKLCDSLGLKSIYEYRAQEINVHISYPKGHRPKDEPFITNYPNIYES